MAFCVDFAEAYKVNVRAEYYNIESVSIALANVEGVKVAVRLHPVPVLCGSLTCVDVHLEYFTL